MKKTLLFFVLFAPAASFAQITPEQVASECKRQMSMGICMTRPDGPTVIPGQAMMLSGVGKVSYSAYMDYIDLYNPKNPADSTMCDLAKHYMSTAPNSDHSKIAVALWGASVDLPSEPTPKLVEIGLKTGMAVLVAYLTLVFTLPKYSRS
jgi:hypothetical protein